MSRSLVFELGVEEGEPVSFPAASAV